VSLRRPWSCPPCRPAGEVGGVTTDLGGRGRWRAEAVLDESGPRSVALRPVAADRGCRRSCERDGLEEVVSDNREHDVELEVAAWPARAIVASPLCSNLARPSRRLAITDLTGHDGRAGLHPSAISAQRRGRCRGSGRRYYLQMLTATVFRAPLAKTVSTIAPAPGSVPVRAPRRCCETPVTCSELGVVS